MWDPDQGGSSWTLVAMWALCWANWRKTKAAFLPEWGRQGLQSLVGKQTLGSTHHGRENCLPNRPFCCLTLTTLRI